MPLIKVSDYIAECLVAHGVEQVFMVTGGGAMHLNHSIGQHARLNTVFMHHEQACAIAAEAYGRYGNKLACVQVTSGPGGTNTITGVYGAFVDSVGVLIVSGQVKVETTVRATGLALRQYGDQELDIEPIVRPITKYAVMVTDTKTIRYHIEKAIYLARSGRPGPCWVDVPLDVQASMVDPEQLSGFDPSELDEPWKATDLAAAAQAILVRLATAERPVVFAGGGVRLSGAHAAFIDLIERLGVPVVTGWNAHDAIWNDHPLYCGRPGTLGDRGGNMVTQSADFLLILGSRLNIRQVSYNWVSFARAAYKVWVDIDPVELQKPSVTPDMPVVADLKDLLPVLIAAPYDGPSDRQRDWLTWACGRGKAFPVVLPEYRAAARLNPYVAIEALFDALAEDDVVISANGSACVMGFQSAKLRRGQRMWTNSGCATMGYDLPASVGAFAATRGTRRIVCLAGDGSIMMNLQELQTISGYGLPLKVFLINNGGYVSQIQTQRAFFGGIETGSSPRSHVTFPDFADVAHTFRFAHLRVDAADQLAGAIAQALASEGPVICEFIVDGDVPFAPKLGSRQLPDGTMVSSPLEDLSPRLARDVLRANMKIDLIAD